MAFLTPVPDSPAPSVSFVRRAVEELAARGFRQVVTPALSSTDQAGFLAAGFHVHQQLHLLTHDLRSRLPTADTAAVRKARREDRPAVIAIDNRAFPPFWRLDDAGLDEALHATPHRRFCVARPGSGVVGYAVTGRAGRRGYLQRVAVDPLHQGRGLGRALVVDALRWLRRWRVEDVLVNTPEDNKAALALYEGLGFRHERRGLSVLTMGLDS